METSIDKQSFGEAGCIRVSDGNIIPQGQYCAIAAVTDIILPELSITQAPLTASPSDPTVSTISSQSFPAGFTLFTPINIGTGGTAFAITGDAIFYRAL